MVEAYGREFAFFAFSLDQSYDVPVSRLTHVTVPSGEYRLRNGKWVRMGT